MHRPAELKSSEKLNWLPGRGTDLASVQALVAQNCTLVRAHYGYRKPLYFAVPRENAFRRAMPIRYPTTFSGRDMAHAHNHLLQAALDLGIPGLVAYAAVWMITAVLLVAVYRRCGERIYRALAGGLGAGLSAHFVFGMADAIPLGAKVGVLFWMTLALVVGLHRVALVRSMATPRGYGFGCVPVAGGASHADDLAAWTTARRVPARHTLASSECA